jgi:hypothetical protein
LKLSGLVHFICGHNLKLLLESRLGGGDLQIALEDLERAQSGANDSPVGAEAVVANVSAHQQPESPHVPVVPQVAPPPQPAPPSVDNSFVPCHVCLPVQPDWLDDAYMMGKKYGLADHEISAQLKAELEHYRRYWLDDRVKGREGEALSPDTVERRIGRAILFLGFVRLIGGIEIKEMCLSACCNTDAVQAFLDWHQTRGTKASNARSQRGQVV